MFDIRTSGRMDLLFVYFLFLPGVGIRAHADETIRNTFRERDGVGTPGVKCLPEEMRETAFFSSTVRLLAIVFG